MMIRMSIALVLGFVFATMLLAAGCGTDDGGGSDGLGSRGDFGGNFNGKCCINNKYYQCDTKAAFDKCAGFDVFACQDACDFTDSQCFVECGKKAANSTHDPSSCSAQPARDGDCKTTPTGCHGHSNGKKCTYSHQCGTNYHCNNGKCYPDAVGEPCQYSHQCGPGHCTNKCCYSNAAGSPCEYSHQCGSNNCTGGKCQ